MAFFTQFVNKGTGNPLVSVSDFLVAPVNTQFEKGTGEVYYKTVDGLFLKIDRVFLSEVELNLKFDKLQSDAVAFAIALG